MDDLDGDVAPVLLVAREVHARHPASSELFPDAIAVSQYCGECWSSIVVRERVESVRDGFVEERRVAFGLGEQVLELASERGVPAGQLRNASRALLGGHVDQLVQQRL